MPKVLSQKFFNRPALTVAKHLLGKFLVRKIGAKKIALQITEIEAYDGFEDKASHASRGQTKRNALMFGPAGYFYVYLCYGMHWMLNITTAQKGYPAAILIRAAGELNGPARLTKFLKIDSKFNAQKASNSTRLWFEDRGVTIKPTAIKTSPRIGVHYAGPIWSQKPYRFFLQASPKGLLTNNILR